MRAAGWLGLMMLGAMFSVVGCLGQPLGGEDVLEAFLEGRWRWRMSPPLVAPVQRPEDACFSVKDPSVVYYDGHWRLFCTIRSARRTHQIEYLTFTDWAHANAAPRRVLTMHPGYFCAPEVFFFEPHRKWYLICQASDPAWEPDYGAAYSTTTDVADPNSWSKLTPLGHRWADGKAGLDFWVICDEKKAYLFFTTLDGRMWREETSLADFPAGWSEPALAIEGDIFEAGHVYRLKGLGKYLAIVEAQNGHGWRYYKAYLADRLDGDWLPLAADRDRAFASLANVVASGDRWTDSISHGELIRAGYDQRLEVDPANLRFLFQGVLDTQRVGKSYGEIPWRLGLLEPL
ncbi:MAG: non-reducing end alpha-L-arabinofuranosidase family hydrolase [Armatimonadetes bacterium]|nr:non-reducing end alpha-L-arabinofuranosidase family hydrolase [Armatimonadota bacterium]